MKFILPVLTKTRVTHTARHTRSAEQYVHGRQALAIIFPGCTRLSIHRTEKTHPVSFITNNDNTEVTPTQTQTQTQMQTQMQTEGWIVTKTIPIRKQKTSVTSYLQMLLLKIMERRMQARKEAMMRAYLGQ